MTKSIEITPRQKSKIPEFGTSEKADRFVGVDWFQANMECHWRSWHGTVPKKENPFGNYIWPAGLDYFSPFNSVFLSNGISMEDLESRPTWLVRDGLIPLLWFFKFNPKPKKFSSRLLVHEDLASYVPICWRPKVGTYRIIANFEREHVLPTKLLLTGIVAESYASEDFLKKTLQKLMNFLGSKVVQEMEKICFFVRRNDSYSGEERGDYFGEFLFLIGRTLGVQGFRALNWSRLEQMSSLESYYAVDLNEKLLCSDSFIVHSTAGRGAHLLDLDMEESSPSPVLSKILRLSPYHGIRITETIGVPYVLEELPSSFKETSDNYLKFERAMSSHANIHFPWPTWLNPPEKG